MSNVFDLTMAICTILASTLAFSLEPTFRVLIRTRWYKYLGFSLGISLCICLFLVSVRIDVTKFFAGSYLVQVLFLLMYSMRRSPCPVASSKSVEKEENDFLPTIHPKTDEKMNDE